MIMFCLGIFTKHNLHPGGVYSVIVSQVGTSAPSVQTLINSTGATAVWTRTGVGTYLLTFSTSLFSLNKAEIPNGQYTIDGSTGGFLCSVGIDANSALTTSIAIITVNASYTVEDSLLNSFYFKITFYPL